MPLTLRPPRPGKTPNYEIRGTYRRVHVEISSGTHRRSDALKELRRIEGVIDEHGQYPAPESTPAPDPGQPTFLTAAVAYMRATGQRRGIAALIKHFGEKPLAEITQDAIDTAAMALKPHVKPATRSRYIYIPISAILHQALGDDCPRIKHTYGGKGAERTDFMWPDDAFAVIEEADKIDAEFGLYLRLLLYTGIRKTEGRTIRAADVRPDDLLAWLKTSKNEDPRMLRLRPDLAEALRRHQAKHPDRENLFRFGDSSSFKHYLLRATMAVCGLECPKRRPVPWRKPKFRLDFVTFHVFRHTWATWLRFYGGADVEGLVGTKNWRDERSARRYAHVVPRDEWARVDNLPAMGKTRGMPTKS